MIDGSAEQEGTPPGKSVWRFATATRAGVVVDAADYFSLMRDAMLDARHQILMIGWDFDSRIELVRSSVAPPQPDDPPERLGDFILWLARRNPELSIRLLKWNVGALKMLLRGSMIVDLLRWWWQRGIDFKFDGAHPPGCSHHQKIVVIDDCFAVCGGIDMTGDRWDTRQHLEGDRRRRRPTGRAYDPWHDCTMLMEGDVAAALGEYGRQRWEQAGGQTLPKPPARDGSPWPAALEPQFRGVEMGIARTRSHYLEIAEAREIEALYLEQIARAKRFIYAENQYFASRRIAEALTLRLAEVDPPEIVLINPLTADGWLEQTAMDGARIRLLLAIRDRDHAKRFSMWNPYTDGGTAIYVHAKLMIVDDEVLRVGSSNMNNRSLGLDSECDVFIDCARPGNAGCGEAIRRLRYDLLAEHCGREPDEIPRLIDEYGTMTAMLDALPKAGKTLRRFEVRNLTDAETAIADNEALDPERPEEMLSMYKRRGLFSSRILRRPA